MAIGDYDNNGSSNRNYQSNKPYENTYYPRIRFKNGNRQVNVNYHSGLMQLEVGNISDTDGFKFNSEGSVYLSPFKASMLVDQISAFLKYMESDKVDPKVAFGVNTGMGEKVSFIGFSTDKDKKIYMTVGKFDGTGAVTERTKFEFTQDYNYALEWKDIEANNLSKVYDNMLEIKTLQKMIADFARGMYGGLAYGTIDLGRWDTHRFNKRIDQVFDKLGIERQQYGGSNRSYSGTNNFLDGASSSSSSKSATYEDLEDLLA